MILFFLILLNLTPYERVIFCFLWLKNLTLRQVDIDFFLLLTFIDVVDIVDLLYANTAQETASLQVSTIKKLLSYYSNSSYSYPYQPTQIADHQNYHPYCHIGTFSSFYLTLTVRVVTFAHFLSHLYCPNLSVMNLSLFNLLHH